MQDGSVSGVCRASGQFPDSESIQCDKSFKSLGTSTFIILLYCVCYCLLQTLLPAGEDTFTVSEVIVQATK